MASNCGGRMELLSAIWCMSIEKPQNRQKEVFSLRRTRKMPKFLIHYAAAKELKFTVSTLRGLLLHTMLTAAHYRCLRNGLKSLCWLWWSSTVTSKHFRHGRPVLCLVRLPVGITTRKTQMQPFRCDTPLLPHCHETLHRHRLRKSE